MSSDVVLKDNHSKTSSQSFTIKELESFIYTISCLPNSISETI